MSAEKLCIFCEHLGYDAGGGGVYAEPAELYCNRKHELLSRHATSYHTQFIFDIDDFRAMIKTAENCADYSPAQ